MRDPHRRDPAFAIAQPFGIEDLLPARCRDSRLYIDEHGNKAITIGQGEQSLVVKYLSGPDRGLVCRLGRGSQHDALRCDAVSTLRRFRMHQLAFLIEPEHSVPVVKVDLDRQAIFSTEVERSKENLRDATRKGVLMRSTRTYLPVDPEAQELAVKLEAQGIVIHLDYPNVSVVRHENLPPQIVFFEIDGILKDKLRDTISSKLHGEMRELALGILNRYLFEGELDLMDVYDLGDEQRREELLREKNRIDLEDGYRQEVGRSIIMIKF